MKKLIFDTVVIGGGASGITAACFAARLSCRVLVLEQKEQPCKKLLATGNGKCNFTNTKQTGDCYRSHDREKADSILKAFSLFDTLDFFRRIGIYPMERDGYYYPNSEQASSVQEALLLEARHAGVEILVGERVLSCEKQEDGVFTITTQTTAYEARSVVLATGGKAAPVHGSDGSGYALARAFHHTINPVLPAIVQLKAEGEFFRQLAGARLRGGIKLTVEDRTYESRGELLFASYGLSGIPVMEVSRYAAEGLFEGHPVIAQLDLLPTLTKQEVYKELERRFTDFHEDSLLQRVSGLCHQKVNYVLLQQMGWMPEKKRVTASETELARLSDLYKAFTVKIIDTNGFDNAQACAGGVPLQELTATMESKLVKGLFFVGELADVDGTCGGYNLQWAWSSGAVAGKEIGGRYGSHSTT